jgi:hypothetical protein
MKNLAKKIIKSQLTIAIAVLALNSTAIAKNNSQPNKLYKAEKCDCIGFSDDIPTFLSDLTGAQGIDIYGEGKSLKEAESSAQNMCIETYRNFASATNSGDTTSISQSGCHMSMSTTEGDWVSL